MSIKDLEAKALDLRRKIIQTTLIAGEAGHITSSFSCLDILIALYFGGVLHYDSSNPQMQDRDRFVLSKGHGALAIYNVLCEAGFFKRKELNTYCSPGSIFGGHPTPAIPGIECATGALGHGLPFAVGVALAARLKKADFLTYVVTGDGECQEGSIWEAAMAISQFNLTNLVWIIDYNKLQIKGDVNSIMRLEPLDKKLNSFGFDVISVDGHNYNDLLNGLHIDKNTPSSRPIVVIANTKKGKGVPLFEDKLGWHARKPNREEYNIINEQLNIVDEDVSLL
jgi:transketolase